MTDSDDPLDKLLRATGFDAEEREVSLPPDPSPNTTEADPKGLNPVKLLGLPPIQRDLINWLARRKQAGFDAIQDALQTDSTQARAVIAELIEAGYLHEALIDGKIFYRVVFRGKVSRTGRSLPDSIWQRVDLDNGVFLRQMPLFSELPSEAIQQVAETLDSQHYHRNEIIQWQGQQRQGITFIKNGIVGITRLSPQAHSAQLLAYLTQGDVLGEHGLLAQDSAAALTTATALSEVEILSMKQPDFLGLLGEYPDISLELARLLATRLQTMTDRSMSSRTDTRLSLVIGVVPGCGSTLIGSTLAMILARTTRTAVVYSEFPAPARLAPVFGFADSSSNYQHPAGFDVYVSHDPPLPAAVRATLLLDHLTSSYANIVIGVSGPVDEAINYLLGHADQVALVAPPDPTAWKKLDALKTRLMSTLKPDKIRLYTISNRCQEQMGQLTPPETVDLDIPFVGTLPPADQRSTESLPQPLTKVVAILADRLGRVNEIGVYIPATNQADAYIYRTLDFMDRLFGGPGHPEEEAVLKGDRVKLVDDTVYVVRTQVTRAAMDHHLGDVLAYMVQIKTELEEDVMALEVNQKLMLI